MVKRRSPILNPTNETLIRPPHNQQTAHTRLIFTIFGLTIVAIVAFAIYIAFFTDTPQKASRAIATETQAVYETAAAHSTQTAAAGGYGSLPPTPGGTVVP